MDVRVGMWRKLSAEELMLLNCVVGEDSWESLGLQRVHPKGFQSWIFTGRTDVEAETPILWPPDAKNWLSLLDSVGEGEGVMIWENGIETCIISYMKRIVSPPPCQKKDPDAGKVWRQEATLFKTLQVIPPCSQEWTSVGSKRSHFFPNGSCFHC